MLARAGALEQRIMRLTGVPESELARMLRARGGRRARPLEITTCLRRGELEIATVFAPDAARRTRRSRPRVLERFGARVFSRDGSTIDEIVAALLPGRRCGRSRSPSRAPAG